MGICAIQCPLYQMTERIEYGKRIVEDENTHLKYASGDSDDALRRKFSALFFCAFPLGLPIRLTARVVMIATGVWFYAGYEKAQVIWAKTCLDWHTQGRANPPPSTQDYNVILAKAIAFELVDNIVKCVTLPLSLVGLTFAAFWGLVVPLDGRGLFSDIERAWSISLPEWMTDNSISTYVNFMASCMQPKQVWKEINLYRFKQGYDAAEPRFLLHELDRIKSQGFVDFDDDTLKAWKTAIHRADFKETDTLTNLVATCYELNGVVVDNQPADEIAKFELAKQQALAAFNLGPQV
jgi:hypothetical protein